ncbi:DUF4397 domain-containing protein [Sphaerisporangium corydalis]|uniref:DUF4397 domain-containing protein n=1 Tax=Sphaerisporangium corydalis TaxID=1441875 RepID=A0ABV9ESC0_9ACTN|nr:DUF4397 domain-containing protein [Sphaerisporangium corydalis]
MKTPRPLVALLALLLTSPATLHAAPAAAAPALTASAVAVPAVAVPALAAPALAVSRSAAGYVRLAHFSPDTPAVDVYLYDFGGETPKLVLKHVPYGALSPYQKLSAGQYTVAMRAAGAKASTPPVLSTNVRVTAGEAYTVAGTGPFKSIRLSVLPDTARMPAGKGGIRFVAASLKSRALRLGAGGVVLEPRLRFGTASAYRAHPAGPLVVTAKGQGGESARARVALTSGALHTIIVLDGKNGLTLLDTRDAAGPGITPKGGINTGLGGLASTADEPIASGSSGIGPVAAGVLVAGMVMTLVLVRRARRGNGAG